MHWMSKKIISFLLTVAIILSCFCGVTVLADQEEIKVLGADVAIGETLTVSFFTNAAGEMVLNDKRIPGVWNETQKAYQFRYVGINPQCMGDAITGTFYAESGTELAVGPYSVKQYCENKAKDKESTEKLLTLLADMLNYGAEAQKYKNYKTDALVNDVEALQGKATATFTLPTITKSAEQINDIGRYTVKATSANIKLDNTINVIFTFDLGDMDYVLRNFVIGGGKAWYAVCEVGGRLYGTYSETDNSVEITGLAANDIDKKIVCQIHSGATLDPVYTVTYSVNSYIAAMANDPDIGALVQALSKYGNAAIALAQTA